MGRYVRMAVLALHVIGCGEQPPWPRYVIHGDVPGEAIQDAHRAITWYGNLHYTGGYDFMQGLTVHIHADMPGTLAGLYYHSAETLEVEWRGDVHSNALLHECHHRMLHLTTGMGDYGPQEFGSHTPRFLEEVNRMRVLWRETDVPGYIKRIQPLLFY